MAIKAAIPSLAKLPLYPGFFFDKYSVSVFAKLADYGELHPDITTQLTWLCSRAL